MDDVSSMPFRLLDVVAALGRLVVACVGWVEVEDPWSGYDWYMGREVRSGRRSSAGGQDVQEGVVRSEPTGRRQSATERAGLTISKVSESLPSSEAMSDLLALLEIAS